MWYDYMVSFKFIITGKNNMEYIGEPSCNQGCVGLKYEELACSTVSNIKCEHYPTEMVHKTEAVKDSHDYTTSCGEFTDINTDRCGHDQYGIPSYAAPYNVQFEQNTTEKLCKT